MSIDKTFVMVTGPAASGKSTLCQLLCDDFQAYYYRIADAYFDLAKFHDIPRHRVFHDVDLKELYEYFCDICKQHELTIGDQHLAIQHNRDSALATNDKKTIDIQEPYVAALKYELFDVLNDNDIKPFIIYLNADPELLYERAYKRNLEIRQILRNKSIDDVRNEIQAENYYFNDLVAKKSIDSLTIDTTLNSVNEVHQKAKNMVLQLKRR